MLLGIAAGTVAFFGVFALLLALGLPTWFLFFPIAVGVGVGRGVAKRKSN